MGLRGRGIKVRLKLLQHLSILLFIAGEPQKVQAKVYISLGSSFYKLFKITTFRHLGGIGKTLSKIEVTIMHFASIV